MGRSLLPPPSPASEHSEEEDVASEFSEEAFLGSPAVVVSSTSSSFNDGSKSRSSQKDHASNWKLSEFLLYLLCAGVCISGWAVWLFSGAAGWRGRVVSFAEYDNLVARARRADSILAARTIVGEARPVGEETEQGAIVPPLVRPAVGFGTAHANRSTQTLTPAAARTGSTQTDEVDHIATGDDHVAPSLSVAPSSLSDGNAASLREDGATGGAHKEAYRDPSAGLVAGILPAAVLTPNTDVVLAVDPSKIRGPADESDHEEFSCSKDGSLLPVSMRGQEPETIPNSNQAAQNDSISRWLLRPQVQEREFAGEDIFPPAARTEEQHPKPVSPQSEHSIFPTPPEHPEQEPRTEQVLSDEQSKIFSAQQDEELQRRGGPVPQKKWPALEEVVSARTAASVSEDDFFPEEEIFPRPKNCHEWDDCSSNSFPQERKQQEEPRNDISRFLLRPASAVSAEASSTQPLEKIQQQSRTIDEHPFQQTDDEFLFPLPQKRQKEPAEAPVEEQLLADEEPPQKQQMKLPPAPAFSAKPTQSSGQDTQSSATYVSQKQFQAAHEPTFGTVSLFEAGRAESQQVIVVPGPQRPARPQTTAPSAAAVPATGPMVPMREPQQELPAVSTFSQKLVPNKPANIFPVSGSVEPAVLPRAAPASQPQAPAPVLQRVLPRPLDIAPPVAVDPSPHPNLDPTLRPTVEKLGNGEPGNRGTNQNAIRQLATIASGEGDHYAASGGFPFFRGCRGNGNCFYRSVFVGSLERAVREGQLDMLEALRFAVSGENGRTPDGVLTVPGLDGEPVTSQEFSSILRLPYHARG